MVDGERLIHTTSGNDNWPSCIHAGYTIHSFHTTRFVRGLFHMRGTVQLTCSHTTIYTHSVLSSRQKKENQMHDTHLSTSYIVE
jgi:hypothetical protein